MDRVEPGKGRLLKSIFPVDLVNQVDLLVSLGIGGYKDRNEFIVEATRNHALELGFLARDGSLEQLKELPKTLSDSSVKKGNERAPKLSGAHFRIGDTRLVWPKNLRTERVEDALSAVDEPLLGLHNRDYPSLWATAQIAELTSSEPLPWNACADEVLRRAWKFGEVLKDLDAPGERHSALFPTNEDKRSSSEAAFRSFGLGRMSRTGLTVGPIFQWKLCGLFQQADAEPTIALLDGAPDLFERLAGISAATPHKPEHASVFLDHVKRTNPADFRMLTFVLDVVARTPTRQSLVDDVSAVMTRESYASTDTAATYASGYIARAREWGLVEPKLIDGTYRLTAFGEDTRSRYNRLEL
jgi:hypothetical protein